MGLLSMRYDSRIAGDETRVMASRYVYHDPGCFGAVETLCYIRDSYLKVQGQL